MSGKEKRRSDARMVRKLRRLAENRISADVDPKETVAVDHVVGYEENISLDGNAAEELGIDMVDQEKTAAIIHFDDVFKKWTFGKVYQKQSL